MISTKLADAMATSPPALNCYGHAATIQLLVGNCSDRKEMNILKRPSRRMPRGPNARLERVVIVGQIVAGNLHCHAVELDIRTLGDRLGEGILRQRRIVAIRLKRLDGRLRLTLALAMKLTLKVCLRLRLLLFLRGIMLFLWLTHNELLFAYEHRRHFEIADLLRGDRQEPRCVCHFGPPNDGHLFFEETARVGSLIG
jgi:hypothetical protein